MMIHLQVKEPLSSVESTLYAVYINIIIINQGAPKKALHFLSIRAQSRCDPDPNHILIGPGLTETVTLFLEHPVGTRQYTF